MSTAAISVSGTVTGSRLRISRPTGRSYWSDTPRSPRSARARARPAQRLLAGGTVAGEVNANVPATLLLSFGLAADPEMTDAPNARP